MKTIAVPLFALVALMFPVFSQAATPAQVAALAAWKAEFPAASAADSAKLKQMIAGYQQLVNQVAPMPAARKTLSLLEEKMTRDQLTTNNVLHPTKPTPSVTAAMRADAEAASRWLNEKFAPFFAKVPQ